MTKPTETKPYVNPFGEPGKTAQGIAGRMLPSEFLPGHDEFKIPPGVMRPEREDYYSSTWCLRRQGSVRFFEARLGGSGQGFEQLTPGETNWSGEDFPNVWCPRVEVFGLDVLDPSERALSRFAQGFWTCGKHQYPAGAFIEHGALGLFYPDSLYHRFIGVDPRTWVLTCDVSPTEPLVVRFRVVSKVHE